MNYFFRWIRGSKARSRASSTRFCPRITHTLTWSYSPPVARGVDARRHRHERRLITVAAENVDELRRIRRQPPPTVRLCHFPGIALVEAHAAEHGAARLLDARGQSHAIRVAFDLRAGDDEKRNFCAPSRQHAGDLRHLDEAQLRRREHNHVYGLDRVGVALLECANISLADVVAAHRAPRSENLVEAPGLGSDAGHVEQRNRAVARER